MNGPRHSSGGAGALAATHEHRTATPSPPTLKPLNPGRILKTLNFLNPVRTAQHSASSWVSRVWDPSDALRLRPWPGALRRSAAFRLLQKPSASPPGVAARREKGSVPRS